MAAGLSSHFIAHLLCMYESSSSFSTTHSTPQPLHLMSDVTNASTSSYIRTSRLKRQAASPLPPVTPSANILLESKPRAADAPE
jgi:hypothetical protein